MRGAPGFATIMIASIDGTSLNLTTPDGWSRTVDVAGVTITRDGTSITAADLAVGDTIRLSETANADGTWTVTGIEVVLPTVTGTVGQVGTDSFTITQGDGTTVAIHVGAGTTWSIPGSSAPGIGDLSAGETVAARGTLEADGSMDATQVVAGMFRGGQPWGPKSPQTPNANPSASPSPLNG
jgi:hypothetical protein